MGQKLPPLNALRTFDAAAQTGSFKWVIEQVENDPALAPWREAGHEAPSSRIN